MLPRIELSCRRASHLPYVFHQLDTMRRDCAHPPSYQRLCRKVWKVLARKEMGAIDVPDDDGDARDSCSASPGHGAGGTGPRAVHGAAGDEERRQGSSNGAHPSLTSVCQERVLRSAAAAVEGIEADAEVSRRMGAHWLAFARSYGPTYRGECEGEAVWPRLLGEAPSAEERDKCSIATMHQQQHQLQPPQQQQLLAQQAPLGDDYGQVD
jgi:hypothetical protein